MVKLLIVILINITGSYADNNNTLTPCEIVTTEAVKTAWVYVETGNGFKAMIAADNKVKKI